jgi:hypothetical protein
MHAYIAGDIDARIYAYDTLCIDVNIDAYISGHIVASNQAIITIYRVYTKEWCGFKS